MGQSGSAVTPERPLRLFFSVGDLSADLHAANLIRELKQLRPDAIIEGMGGPKMAEAGCDLRHALTNMNVMGFSSVVRHLHTAWRTQRDTLRSFETHRPDAVVVMDFPGYNMALAGRLRRRRIPVIYYISPQIWAWHSSRIHKIRKRITKVLCIFPFEEEIYRRAGVPVEYVGHPLFDHLSGLRLDEAFCRKLRDEAGPLLIGLLGGSRLQEIRSMLPVMARAAGLIRREMPNVLFAVPCAGEPQQELATQILRRYDIPVRIFVKRTYEVMKEADFCLVTSGTATLELAHFNTPMLIMYRVHLPAYLLVRLLMHTRHIGMVNILGGREVVPDRLLWRDDHKGIARTALDIIRSPERTREIKDALGELRRKLDHPGASRQAAEAILKTAGDLRGFVKDAGTRRTGT
jgi:lipid-A-disaccharide synthase